MTAADASLAEQQMGQLVQKRERPRCPGVVVVDNYERGDVVCDGETAKHLHVDGRVMAAQIPLEQDEYAGTLCSRAEQSERLVGRRLRVVGGGVQVMSEHFAQSLRR